MNSAPVAQSSRDVILETIADITSRETLLGREASGKPINTHVKKIEYGSLRFEESKEDKRLGELNLLKKTTNSTVQPGKIAYKNSSLWSSRSASIEQLLKPLVTCTSDSWPDHESFCRIARACEESTDLLNKLDMGVVDTLIPRINEANEVRYGVDRLCSPWSHSSEKFELTKVCFSYLFSFFIFPLFFLRYC